MSEVVCQVSNQAGAVEFIWSEGGGFFEPYRVSGTQLSELRAAADQTRVALEKLVFDLNHAGPGPPPWEPSYKLAEAGFRLFNDLLPPEDRKIAGRVRRWLEALRKPSGLIGLEIVVEERSDAQACLSVPWNLVYDERPAKYKDAFRKGQGAERWRPFWSIRYNLTSGRRVEPLQRLTVWSDPRVVVVVDPTVHEGLHADQRDKLKLFLDEANLAPVRSMDELEAALKEGYPQLLYWLGHATPEYLMLGDERIAPSDLRNLLRSFDDRERPEGMLAFLNACQTAEPGKVGSFLEVLHSFGFTGAIATEQQTIDTFANEFGLAFLKGFLREGKPLGELLHGLRLVSAPLGLLYGAHCPPEIRVRRADEAAAPSPTAARAWGKAAPIKLPEQPYRSLAFYDEEDRALYTGRDADVVRFAATLDRPDTRIMVLHGESGLGKTSFLRAGVIPYLEQECVGYRFFRRPDGSALIVQAARDLVGQFALTLLDASASPLHYDTPDGQHLTVDLRRVLDEALGAPADYAALREALRRDARLLADLLARMAGRLPHALVLVLDQAEEVFTLVRPDETEEVDSRNHALRMLQRIVDVPADVKLIVSLRTEYYGRLLDHLRAGRRDSTGVREDLLRDFSRPALIEAIARPTSETPLAEGEPSPRKTYRFRFAEGIPEQIADDVLGLRSENQDSVLPLVQVICTQLYEREKSLPGADGVITREDLDAIQGVEGGLRAFAEDALVRSLRLNPEDREAFKALFSKLYNRQPDGTLTARLTLRASLEAQWDRPSSFAELLEAAKAVRLLREDELRIEGNEPRRYVRLGHDALAKVADAWRAEREEKQRLEQELSMRREKIRRLLVDARKIVYFALLSNLVLMGLGVWLRGTVEGVAKSQLAEDLRVILKADVEALRLGFQAHQALVQIAADDSRVRALAGEIVATPARDPAALLRSERLAELRELLRPWMERYEYNGFVIIDEDGLIVAAKHDALIGKSHPAEEAEFGVRALAGRATVSRPFPSLAKIPDLDGTERVGVPTMFAAAPLRGGDDKVFATLEFSLAPELVLSRILGITRRGASGETYAFDRAGRMLSPSRFDDDLKRIGLLADQPLVRSILNVELRDPGVDMTAGGRPAQPRGEQPLTLMAADAVQGRDGVDVAGYRDYRGVPVVGAWTWLPAYGFGIATQIDKVEAYRLLAILKTAFWSLQVLLTLVVATIFLYMIVLAWQQWRLQKSIL